MHKQKICLITPPSSFLLDERVFMHLGILKVASVLEERGYLIDFLDLSGIENYIDVIIDYCSIYKTNIFGLTASTPQIPFAVKIARRIRDIIPEAKIILGGPHATLMHTASKREAARGLDKGDRATRDVSKLLEIFDILVCGDGELAIFEALAIKSGVVDADDRRSRHFLTSEHFSNLPMPARHLVDVHSYKYTIEGKRSTNLIAQLGCPFQCTFCSGRNSPFLRMIRRRSSNSVIDEMRHLYEVYGFTGFMFYDDELNVNKDLVELLNKITELQNELGEEFRLRGFIKAELFNDEQAAAMYRAGFRWLLAGFESGDEKILKIMKKIATREDNTRAVEIAKRHGLKIKALMSAGHVGESRETIENTKEWLLKVQPEDIDCTIITSYPGSPCFDDAIKAGDVYVYTSDVTGDKLYQSVINYHSESDYFKGDPNDGYTSHVWTDHLTPEELVMARDDLERSVRKKLGIPFNPSNPGKKYEHSSEAGDINIPDFILRKSYR